MADSISGLFFGFDRLNQVASGLERTLETAAVDYASDSGAAAGVQAVQRLEDGTLAPLDLTPGLTSSQRAFNQAARNAYVARVGLEAEDKASQLMSKYQLDPEGFKAAWDAYSSNTLQPEANGRLGAALALDLMKIGNQSYARISAKKLEYDRAEQSDTFIKRAKFVQQQAASLAARTGSIDNEEIRAAQSEFDALVGNLLNGNHISRGAAEEMRRNWGRQIMLDAFSFRVDQAYQQGKTPLGPGSIVDAQRVARELSMEAAETLAANPREAFAMLMGQAEISQRMKMAVVGEKREAMALDNERRAAAAHARADQERAQRLAADRTSLALATARANGDAIDLYPGASSVGGDDAIQGGGGGRTLFKSQEEMVKALGPGGAAALIERNRAYQRERERDATTAANQAASEMRQGMSVARPVERLDPDTGKMRMGLMLPDGQTIYSAEEAYKLTDNKLLALQLGSSFNDRLSGLIRMRDEADQKSFSQQIGESRAAVDAMAQRVLDSKAPITDLIQVRDMLRLQLKMDDLPEDRQAKITQVLQQADQRVNEVQKEFDARDQLRLKSSASGAVALSQDERKRWLQIRPDLDMTKPSADPQSASRVTAMYAEHLIQTGMQVDERTATWLAAVAQRGNIAGGQAEVDLQKAFTLFNRIEQLPEHQKTLFRSEMTKIIPNWGEISTIARRAMEHHLASGTETSDGDRKVLRYATSYAQAYKDINSVVQQRKAEGVDAGDITPEKARRYMEENLRNVAPQLVQNMGWIEWGAWQVSSVANIPRPMMERYAEHFNNERRLGDGVFTDAQAHAAAIAGLRSDGWAPTTMETAPRNIAGGPRVEWRQKPIEWHLQQQGYEFGKQALTTAATAAIAQQRGLSFDAAWKLAVDGRVTLSRADPNSTRVNVILFDPAGATSGESARPTILRDNTGRPVTIDIGSTSFRQFHHDFTRDVFQRARDFDATIKVPSLRIDNQPVGQKMIENTLSGPITLPLGNLIRDRIADPTGGSAARRSLDRLIGIQQEQNSPALGGGDEGDTLLGGNSRDTGYDNWDLAAALWLKKIRSKEGSSTSISRDDVREMGDFMRQNSRGWLRPSGWPKDAERAIEELLNQ